MWEFHSLPTDPASIEKRSPEFKLTLHLNSLFSSSVKISFSRDDRDWMKELLMDTRIRNLMLKKVHRMRAAKASQLIKEFLRTISAAFKSKIILPHPLFIHIRVRLRQCIVRIQRGARAMLYCKKARIALLCLKWDFLAEKNIKKLMT
jgi:hypothetical protein